MADDAGKIAAAALYERDFVAWTEAQATALAAGRLNELDLTNLAEEVGDLGISEVNACRSYVTRIIEHLLKIQHVRSPDTVNHWRGELVGFRGELSDRLTRTIERRVRADLDKLQDRAVRAVQAAAVLNTSAAAQARAEPYTWEQIVDPDYYPEGPAF